MHFREHARMELMALVITGGLLLFIQVLTSSVTLHNYAITLSPFAYALINFMLIGIAALITVVQPYKKTSHNIFNTLIVLTVTLITASMTSMSSSVERQHSHSYAAFVLTAMSLGIPLLYLTAILLHWVYRSGVFGLLCKMCKRCRQINICCSRGRRRSSGVATPGPIRA